MNLGQALLQEASHVLEEAQAPLRDDASAAGQPMALES